MDLGSMQQTESYEDTTDTYSEEWDERKKEKFYKKHRDLMDQRLRSRAQKTKRLKETTPTEYNETFVDNDIVEHWNKLNEPNADVNLEVVKLFKDGKNGGKTYKRRTNKRRKNKKRKSYKKKSHVIKRHSRRRVKTRQNGGGVYVYITDPQFTGFATIVNAETHTDISDWTNHYKLTIKPANSTEEITLNDLVPEENIKVSQKPEDIL